MTSDFSELHPSNPEAPSQEPAPGPMVDLVPNLIHLKRILVPTDFSPASAKALDYGLRLAQQFDSAVRLVHVVEPIPPYPVDGLAYPIGELSGADGELVSDAIKAMELLCSGIQGREGLQLETEVRSGRAYDEIVRAAKESMIDMIIIATHGHSGLKHVLLGSTAERVVRYAPCPVLVVREREHEFI